MCSDPVTSHNFQLHHPSAAAFTSLSSLFRSLAARLDQTSLHNQFCTVCGAPYWHWDFIRHNNSTTTAGSKPSKGNSCHCCCNSGSLSNDARQKTNTERNRGESPQPVPLPSLISSIALISTCHIYIYFYCFYYLSSQLAFKSNDSKAFVCFVLYGIPAPRVLPGIKEVPVAFAEEIIYSFNK